MGRLIDLEDLEGLLEESALAKNTEGLLLEWGFDPPSVARFAQSLARAEVERALEAETTSLKVSVLILMGFDFGYRARMLAEQRSRENGDVEAVSVRGDLAAERGQGRPGDGGRPDRGGADDGAGR